ncbi:lycopene cyclase domain-containing protein [Salinimicrobium flavum]|uniref:Lycopene cyclase domain-containing protein n=2 Tax=Salinimicrobium flavum TaxID=1737065 RepID=A0ABW5J2E1_9FLAO
MEYTYLLVNFFTIIIPFIFSFHPKLNFHKTWKAFFPAVIFTGVIFVVWDMYFTEMGVWGFNDKYLTGINVGNLPLEEVLFFFCIPYACVFTFHCLDLFLKKRVDSKNFLFSYILIFFLLVLGILNLGKAYTSSTFLSLAVLLAFAVFYLKLSWLNRFYAVYAVLLLPFFLVNGVLTGTGLEEEVVWYNSEEFMNFRIGTVPFEDIFYGMELILVNLIIYRYLLVKMDKSTVTTPITQNS